MFALHYSSFAVRNLFTVTCVALCLCVPARAQLLDPLTNGAQTSASGSGSSSLAGAQQGGVRVGSTSSADSASDADDPLLQDKDSDALSPFAPRVTLPADQILRILESQPSLTVELKSVVADRLTAQGVPTDANSFTDEQFYAQIVSNASLRTDVTTYLRARGYITSADLATAAIDSAASEPVDSTSVSGLSQQGLDGRSLSTGMPDRLPRLQSRQPRTNTDATMQSNSIARTPEALRKPTPYNLQSLRDLYTQVSQEDVPLRRFGSAFFTHAASSMARGGSDAPLDVPLGPDYVVGAGDTLTINLWGGTTQTFTRTVSRDGTLLLPEAGSLQVAGLPLSGVEAQVQTALARQFHDLRSSITVSRLRGVRVYITGDVQRPGGYDLSPLATPLSALYVAGGPTATGSLRIVRHLRGSLLIEQIDLYDFLLHGVRAPAQHFESGDTLEVPTAGPQVSIGGAVRRPAIYELAGDEHNLQSVIDDAGGLLPSAAVDHITVERIEPNAGRSTLTVQSTSSQQAGQNARASFTVRDGDRVFVSPTLPYSERVVYLAGHVARPGRIAYRDGLRLSDVLHSERDLLPEPASRGELVRLVPPDLHVETVPFNLREVLIGNENLSLQPFDTIRVFGRYEQDAPTVTVTGEVQRPGSYPLSDGMTAAQLVRMAGGFERAALRDTADLTSYTVSATQRVEGTITSIRIGAAVDGSDAQADCALKPGDVLTVREITGWGDIGQSVTVDGQVRYPGT